MTAYWPDFDSEMKRKDFLEKIAEFPVTQNGFFTRARDGRLDHSAKALPVQSPWIFLKSTNTRHCNLWNQVYFRHFNLIPSFCRFCCWKVVVKPPTVKELFKLEPIFKSSGETCKCGMDVREYTPDPWAGFMYTDSMMQGREKLKKIKGMIAEFFGKNHGWDCFLKRGCTEMEMAKPADQWDDVTEWEIEKEHLLDEMFVKREEEGHQSNWLKQQIRRRWIRRAIGIGDKTWREVVINPDKYLPHTVRFDNDKTFRATMSDKGSEEAIRKI